MKRNAIITFFLLAWCIVSYAEAPSRERSWARTEGIVYGHAKGQDLIIDIYTPTGKGQQSYLQPGDGGKGLGIIDVISGGWDDSDARRGEHEAAGLFNVMCARGYTVFAVRPGGLPLFNGLDMVENLHRAIRWVKAHASEYNVDPDRLGLVGASAGGHLSLLTMASAQPGDPAAGEPLMRYDSSVKAVAVFFPPTDFLDWDGSPINYERRPYLLFSDGLEGKSREEQDARAEALSPVRQIRTKTPPVFIIHGDQDPVVPLQQSEVLLERLHEVGTDATLVVNEGGGHFWLTIYREIIMAADWLDEKLRE